MFGRMRLRLTAWYATTFLLLLLMLGVGTYVSLVWALDREVDASIRAVADDWAASAPPLDTLQPLDVEAHFEGVPSDVFLMVFRSDGVLVANTRAVEADEIVGSGLLGAALGGHEAWTTASDEDARMRLRATPLVEHGAVAGAVIAGRNLAGRDQSVRTILVVLGLFAGGGLVLAAGASYVLAGHALTPLRIAHERQRAFIGDASHELRSPVTLMRVLAELLQRGRLDADQRAVTDQIVAVADEASDLIDQLLLLARLSEPDAEESACRHSDLADAAAVAAEQLAPLLAAHASAVEHHLDAADAALPEFEAVRVLRALLENVVAHTPPGTRVRITTRTEDDQAVLVVEDAGPGVPDADLARIFERFAQLNPARTPGEGAAGSGLGLAIVQAIAERRAGRATADRSALGGLAITVAFPTE